MATLANPGRGEYRPEIDGLRAVAVLSVIAYHAFPKVLRGGFIGVDVFFVISGYLITRIIADGLQQGRFSVSEFYSRRIKRIFPALLVVLIACYAFGWFVLFADEFQQVGKHIAGGAGFISNLLLWDESGYFDAAAETKPLLHLWSLGIEEQFYIAWPLALWAAWKCRLNLLWFAGLVACASFAWSIYSTATDPVSAFYLPHARAWELLVGALLACWELKRRASASSTVLSPLLGNLASLAGAGLLGFGLNATNSARAFPGWWALPPTLAAALFIAAGPRAWVNRLLLARRGLVLIGLISFPLYLWHWPLLVFARIITGQEPSALVRAAAILLAVLLAVLTYRFAERPLRLPHQGRGWRVPVLLAAMALVGGGGLLTFKANGFPERAALGSKKFDEQFRPWQNQNNRLCKARFRFPEAKSYSAWFCMINEDAAPRVLVLGNSYANHLYPGLASEPELSGNVILSIGSCSVDMGYILHNPAGPRNYACSGLRPWHQRLFIDELVKQAGSVEYAIIDGLSYDNVEELLPRVEQRVAFLEENRVQVIVFVPHIRANHRDLRGCFRRPLQPKPLDCDLDPGVRDTLNSNFARFRERLSTDHPNLKFFDQNDLFCQQGKCSLLRNGMPLFRDHESHYSEYASSEVAKLFVAWAKVNAPGILKRSAKPSK